VRGNRLDVHTHGHNHRWGTIVEGSRKRLSHLSFGVFEDDFPRFKERLNNLRVPLLEAPPGFESNGLWFHSPDGLLMELRVADKTSPNEKSSFMMASAPAGTQSSPNRSQGREPIHVGLPMFWSSRPMWLPALRSMNAFLVCGYRTDLMMESPSCTVFTAAIIICLPSPRLKDLACII
jgi:hypothetical protein